SSHCCKRSDDAAPAALEDREVELAEALGIAHHLDPGNIPVCERETEHPEQPSARSEDDSHRAVDERRPCEPGTASEVDRALRPVPRTATSLGAPGATAAASIRTTRSGSSTARSASKSPPRRAARKASTTSR